MATFNVVVGDPDSGLAYQLEADGQDANRFMGKSIGDEVDGGALGLDGYTLEITGGSDETGRPLHAGVTGSSLTEVMMRETGTGYHQRRDGERRRVTVRGREIADDVSQINATVTESGSTAIDELLGEGDDEAEE
ncbi:30S ribosomal protein S6e [Halovivax asiaticus JCM 14624]|uniref:Small ribosomal subunit protein eS6 n=1 Tax=Halovivax asiaticus JCM 14624 TaxID=1227490 RepID=M0BQP6_9EURY|nr:30S ribosomal protein S6e [Halovivax asiaticus]ELZ11979.1 30S ribosomal protein S6e [Halovivax asiaticus JCM 14624]